MKQLRAMVITVKGLTGINKIGPYEGLFFLSGGREGT